MASVCACGGRELVRRVLSHMPGRSLSVMEVYRGTGGKHEFDERATELVVAK
jgi:hypothetical protein